MKTTIPIDLRLPPDERWRRLLATSAADKWVEVFREFDKVAGAESRKLFKSFGAKALIALSSGLHPALAEYLKELKGITKYLAIDYHTSLAGQMLYDAVTSGVLDGSCGCTSMAMKYKGRPWHGRLLDWGWPESLEGGVMKVPVAGCIVPNLTLEILPGLVGATGGYTRRMAANLNQAPVSNLRTTGVPALLWFRSVLERGRLCFGMYPEKGPMTDCLLHVTDCRGTAIVQYKEGTMHKAEEHELTSKPVVLTNSMATRMKGESKDWFGWSKERRDAVTNSKRRKPEDRLMEAECASSIHAWVWQA